MHLQVTYASGLHTYRESEYLTANLFEQRKGVKRYENLNFEKI